MNLLEYLQTNKIKIIDNSIILPEGDWSLENNVLIFNNNRLREYLKNKVFIKVGDNRYHLINTEDTKNYSKPIYYDALENYSKFYIPSLAQDINLSDIKDFEWDEDKCNCKFKINGNEEVLSLLEDYYFNII